MTTTAHAPRLDGYLHLFATELKRGDVIADRYNSKYDATVIKVEIIEEGRTVRVDALGSIGWAGTSYYGPGDLFAVVRR